MFIFNSIHPLLLLMLDQVQLCVLRLLLDSFTHAHTCLVQTSCPLVSTPTGPAVSTIAASDHSAPRAHHAKVYMYAPPPVVGRPPLSNGYDVRLLLGGGNHRGKIIWRLRVRPPPGVSWSFFFILRTVCVRYLCGSHAGCPEYYCIQNK